MFIKFQKYQGAGNDFIIIDNRQFQLSLSIETVARLCNRRFGIGADGLMLLEDCPGYDFRMRYFNADGHEASMCGNGGRCITAFAHELGLFRQSTRFIAVDGEHEATMSGPHSVKLKMCDVRGISPRQEGYFLNTGSPHYVKLVEAPFQMNVFEEGKKIRYSSGFMPEGTNVDFIHPTAERIETATYERGVEDETLACGTGCVASALTVALIRNDPQNTYALITKGGLLQVSFKQHPDHSFTDIWLQGPATFVFSGEYEQEPF